MSLKILLDPILTTRDPAKCSTYVQFYTFVTRTLAERDDVFFTWLLAPWVTEEDMDWMPNHPNVRYIRVPQHRDRMLEYVLPARELLELVSFWGDVWDYDVLLTVRAGLIPLFKQNAISPRQNGMPWTKEVWLIEEMPLMGFKKSVAMINPQVQDLFTLTGYLAADKVFIISHHEKAQIVATAKQWFPPSRVMQIANTIQEVVPTQVDNYQLKGPDDWFQAGAGKQFCVAYVGRMMAAQSNLDKVYSAMTNHWIWQGGDKVRMLVLTPSTGGKSAWPPSHIEVQNAPRDEFWRIAREEMHVLVIMHEDGGFSLSLIEPMMLGVPAIVLDAPWSRALLGPDYPFFVKSEVDVYVLLKEFYEDYAAIYAQYQKYFEESFIPLFNKRFEDSLLYDRLMIEVDRAEQSIAGRYAAVTVGRDENQVIKAVVDRVADREDFVILDVLAELGQEKVLKSLQRKLSDADKETRGMVWKTPWNDFRLMLKARYGFEDASPVTGHMKRGSEKAD